MLRWCQQHQWKVCEFSGNSDTRKKSRKFPNSSTFKIPSGQNYWKIKHDLRVSGTPLLVFNERSWSSWIFSNFLLISERWKIILTSQENEHLVHLYLFIITICYISNKQSCFFKVNKNVNMSSRILVFFSKYERSLVSLVLRIKVPGERTFLIS